MQSDANIQALILKRNELQSRLDRIVADFRRGLDRDSGERAVELENADVLNEIMRVTEDELAKVKLALTVLEGKATSIL